MGVKPSKSVGVGCVSKGIMHEVSEGPRNEEHKKDTNAKTESFKGKPSIFKLIEIFKYVIFLHKFSSHN